MCRCGSGIFSFAEFAQEAVGNIGEQLDEEVFLVVFGEFHTAKFRENGVLGFLVGRNIVGVFGCVACDLLAEFRINGHRSGSVFAFHQCHKLVVGVGVVGIAVATVEGERNCLATHNLAGRSNERNKTGVFAHLRNQAHRVFE